MDISKISGQVGLRCHQITSPKKTAKHYFIAKIDVDTAVNDPNVAEKIVADSEENVSKHL